MRRIIIHRFNYLSKKYLKYIYNSFNAINNDRKYNIVGLIKYVNIYSHQMPIGNYSLKYNFYII